MGCCSDLLHYNSPLIIIFLPFTSRFMPFTPNVFTYQNNDCIIKPESNQYYGTMDGYLDVWTSGSKKYVQGRTYCTSKVSKISVAIAIVSYPDGDPIYDYNNTTVSNYDATSVSTYAYSFSKNPVSAFGAHQVENTVAYGDYTALTNA